MNTVIELRERVVAQEELRELREEFNQLRFAGVLAAECGSACANCGSEDCVEYHHVVPLCFGGTNNLRNIVALCHRCHKAAHGSHHIQRYMEHTNAGRKPKIPDEEAFLVYDRWIDGQFGNKKCAELLGLKRHTHPNQTVQYERWLADRGIVSVRNNYDVAMVSSYNKLEDSYPVGHVCYEDGSKRPILMRDLGENDDVEHAFFVPGGRTEKCVVTWGEMKEWLNSYGLRTAEIARNRCWMRPGLWKRRFEEAFRRRFNIPRAEARSDEQLPSVI